MHKLLMLGAIALASASVSTHVAAGDTPESTVKAVTFESLDRNADRQISRTEAGFDRVLSNDFAFLDTNGDGFLSRDEYAGREQNPARTARAKS